jgi:tripartite-type tricarboxylate transporter receptor subunit TctC
VRHGFRTTTAAFAAIMNVDAGGLIVKTGSHYKTAKVARVPSQGAGPAMADVVAGGVDLVTASLPKVAP